MKKQIIIATLALGAIVFGTNKVQAQTATTAVNIILSDVISLEGSAAVVNFNYDTAEAYNIDQNHSIPGNLKVTSTTPFGIKVKAEADHFVGSTQNIPLSVLTIEAKRGGTTTMNGLQSAIILSTTDQPLISDANFGSELLLDINYFIPKEKSSSSDILGKRPDTFTQNVTYTATAQ